MNCDDIASLLDDARSLELSPARQADVDAHLIACESCSYAWRAAHALRAWGDSPEPAPRSELFAEIVRRTTEPAVGRVRRNAFWTGAGVGGALAAGIVLAVISASPARDDAALDGGIPALTIALNEPHDVSVAIDSGAALTAAEIRVVLTGDIRLAGFGDQSVVTWNADLDPGVNRLTLPIVAVRPAGGRLLVEIAHHSKRQIFVVDVGVASEAAAQPDLGNSMEPLRDSAV